MNILDHQQFIHAVAKIAINRLPEEERAKCDSKLTYGVGQPGLRGVTYFQAWKDGDKEIPFVEVCAAGQSDSIQLAGTTIHEIGHVLAGLGAGHSSDWKNACGKLGLRRIKAAGTVYHLSNFEPDIRIQIANLIKSLDKAQPNFKRMSGRAVKPAPCPAGIGTRGGKSRGAGSGSRMLKFQCNDCGAVWRMSAKWAESVECCPCCKDTSIDRPE